MVLVVAVRILHVDKGRTEQNLIQATTRFISAFLLFSVALGIHIPDCPRDWGYTP